MIKSIMHTSQTWEITFWNEARVSESSIRPCRFGNSFMFARVTTMIQCLTCSNFYKGYFSRNKRPAPPPSPRKNWIQNTKVQLLLWSTVKVSIPSWHKNFIDRTFFCGKKIRFVFHSRIENLCFRMNFNLF